MAALGVLTANAGVDLLAGKTVVGLLYMNAAITIAVVLSSAEAKRDSAK